MPDHHLIEIDCVYYEKLGAEMQRLLSEAKLDKATVHLNGKPHTITLDYNQSRGQLEMNVEPPLPDSFDLASVTKQLGAELDKMQIQQQTRQTISAALQIRRRGLDKNIENIKIKVEDGQTYMYTVNAIYYGEDRQSYSISPLPRKEDVAGVLFAIYFGPALKGL